MLFRCLCKLSLGMFVLALAACSGGSNESNIPTIDYLAVQLDKGENWSIIDADGKVIVKEEYAPDDKMSIIFQDGVYWVKSNADGKFRLFSIDSPKTPLTDEEYEEVTAFSDGLAFVSHITKPIQIIDTKGKVVKTLPNNICRIKTFSDDVYRWAWYNGMAIFEDKNGKLGYINLDGEIVIKALYESACPFSDNLAIVKEEGSNNNIIIDKNGKKRGVIDSDKYQIRKNFFSEGKLTVENLQTGKLVYLNEKGLVELNPVKDYDWNIGKRGFISGYAVVRNKNSEWSVINAKGENVIRSGKYSSIDNVGKGMFVAEKNDKWGVVDFEDNIIVDFNYSKILSVLLGNKFICCESTAFLVDEKGNEVRNLEFVDINITDLPSVSFVNVQSTAQSLVADIMPQGYKPIVGKKSAGEIAKVYKTDSQKQSRYTKELNVDGFKANLSNVTVRLDFNAYIIKEKTHKEVVSDGWFANERTVSDGWDWNNEAELECVVLKMGLNEKVDFNIMADAVGKQLEKNGFKFVGPIPSERIYEAKNGDKFARVSISEGRGSEVAIFFYPYVPYSQEMVDYD